MDILKLKDERHILSSKAEELIDLAKVEKRKLTDEESESFQNYTTQISQMSNEIALAESRGLQSNKEFTQVESIEVKSMKKFSLLRAIENRSNGIGLDEDMLKVVEAGKLEMRKSGQSYSGDIVLPLEYRSNILAGTATQGQETVSEQKMTILEPLRAAMVLVAAGANFITGLTGDVSIPTYAGTSALWKGEIESADDGAGAFAEINLSPKRLTTYINVSKQFLTQDSVNAEELLMRDIVNSVASKLEATILGKADVSPNMPGGLFFTAPTIAGVASFANMVALETAVDSSNALVSNMKYITNPAGRGILKSTVKAAGQPIYILENGEVNGYPVLVTNNVASGLQVGANENGIVFGNFNDLVIAQWGGFDITIDPYSLAKTAQVQITITAYFDAKVRRAASFKTGSLK